MSSDYIQDPRTSRPPEGGDSRRQSKRAAAVLFWFRRANRVSHSFSAIVQLPPGRPHLEISTQSALSSAPSHLTFPTGNCPKRFLHSADIARSPKPPVYTNLQPSNSALKRRSRPPKSLGMRRIPSQLAARPAHCYPGLLTMSPLERRAVL